MHWLACLFCTSISSLQSQEWREVGLMKSQLVCIFLTSSVWSVPLYPECRHWCPHIPFPLHQTFHPWSRREALENVLSNVKNFLLTHPREVSPVWYWASGRHFAPCDTAPFSLTFQVSSSRLVVAHFVCSAHTPEHKGAPIMGVMRRSQFWWRTHEHSVCWFFIKWEGTPSAMLHSTLYNSSSDQSFTFLLPL